MRCIICDTKLFGSELLSKDVRTGKFLDTCGTCMTEINQSLAELPEKIVLDTEEE